MFFYFWCSFINFLYFMSLITVILWFSNGILSSNIANTIHSSFRYHKSIENIDTYSYEILLTLLYIFIERIKLISLNRTSFIFVTVHHYLTYVLTIKAHICFMTFSSIFEILNSDRNKNVFRE